MRVVVLICGVIILFFSVILHEIAHGLMAERHGDSTARMMGRITLNPIPHIDPVGTILLPGIMIIMNLFGGGPIFGWAKPVPINPRNLNNPKKDMIWVASAGVLTNICIALFLALLFRLFDALGTLGTLSGTILFYGITINLFLAFFNLIPIPPLDGSRILSGVLPEHLSYRLARIEPFGFIIIVVLLFTGLLRFLFVALWELSAILTGVSFF